MKKIIILLLVLLMSACSAVKPAETLSSMQTEPTAETTVAETTAPEETTESTPKETETAIKVPKEETTAPLIIEQPEQKATLEITTETITETPVESATMETTAEPPTTPQMPVETVEIPETVETPPESVTEPPKAEFDVNYWISFARSYALQIGLEIDPTALDCWDNPTTANADCIYLERDLTHRLDRYNRDDNITAVNIWAESLGNGNYLIYIAYA
ncbi:MAG: hypothetical protein MR987_05915 [Oscillospiraceae bacterium]|nr:hypothetical protein [Oscillospiraceae bacterium]